MAVLRDVRGAHTLVYTTLPLPLLILLQVLLGKTFRRHEIYCFIITGDAVSLKNLLPKDFCFILISLCHTVIQGLLLLFGGFKHCVNKNRETHTDDVCSAAV